MAGFNMDAGELIELAGALAKVPEGAEKLTRVAVRKTARDIKSTAQSIVPVGKSRPGYIGGTLKNSIHTTAITPTASEVTADTNYAIFVEQGTSRMSAQPYMRPAADKHEPSFIQAMEKIAGRLFDG